MQRRTDKPACVPAGGGVRGPACASVSPGSALGSRPAAKIYSRQIALGAERRSEGLPAPFRRALGLFASLYMGVSLAHCHLVHAAADID